MLYKVKYQYNVSLKLTTMARTDLSATNFCFLQLGSPKYLLIPTSERIFALQAGYSGVKWTLEILRLSEAKWSNFGEHLLEVRVNMMLD